MTGNQLNSSEAALHAVDYWQVIKNRYGVIILTFLLVFMTSAVVTYVTPKKFESSAVVQVNPRVQEVTILGREAAELAGANSMTPQFFQTEFQVIRSQKVLQRVASELNLTTRWGMDADQSLDELKRVVKTRNDRGTDLIMITVRHRDAEDAKLVAGEVAKAYREYRDETEKGKAQAALAQLDRALRDQEDVVEEKRKVLDQIVRTKNFIYDSDKSIFGGLGASTSTGIGATTAAQAYFDLEKDKGELQSQVDNLLKKNSDELIIYAASLDLPDNVIKTLHPQYLEAQRMLRSLMSDGLGKNHPTVKGHEQLIEEMKKQLDAAVVALRSTLMAQLEMITDRLKKADELRNLREEDLLKRSLDQREFVDARDQFEEARKLLDSMRLKFTTESLNLKIPRSPIQIHEEPVKAQAAVSPNVALFLSIGAIVGLIFGVGIAFFLEYLDTSVKSLEDVERYLQVPVLAVIPKDIGVLFKQGGMSPDAEAYRILRTNIEFNRKNPDDNAITVVSGGAGEGKSTTLVNLAYICAQGGYTTLMIDGDLRRPRLHTFFDINNSVGLTNYLTTELMLEDVILQTPIDNLFFMPSGILPSDAAGILNSRRMAELIQDVKTRFDLVLIDSPPIIGVSDASVLASEVDLTMIVVQHRKLPRNMLMRVKQAVENVGGHVLGVVLNNVDVRSDSQYQYYTSYYTYYSPTDAQTQSAVPAPRPVSAPSAKEPAKAGRSGEDMY